MRSLKYSKKFKKELKKINKNANFNIKKLEYIFDLLINGKPLEKKYQDHKLHGEFNNCYECHIKSNLLLIYKIDERNLIIYLLRIGPHSELFG
ncbi:type II toxin-antitoxin system YafQ family toxin [Candidatus Parcubacteria bacterium]|nr:type II toxin-antitoxin system YafQ family toxin [Candidatus Parcubacteria bacterium]